MPCAAATSASRGSTPPQVSLSRSAPAAAAGGGVERAAPARGGAPPPLGPRGGGVDPRGGGGSRGGGEEIDAPPQLLGHVPLVAGAGLPPADVDDVGPVRDGPVDRGER